MIRFLPQAMMMTAISTLLISQTDAYCAKCVKIEENRAKEQAEHPQPWRYYDDVVSLHDDNPANINRSESDNDSSQAEARSSKETSSPSSKSSHPSSETSKNQADVQQHLLAMNTNQQSANSNFFEENEIPNPPNGDNPNAAPSENPEAEDQNFSITPSHPSLDLKTYSTIYTIFKTKNFLETLNGSFTLFIPTNDALTQLPRETLIGLTRPENVEKLASVVSNHVVAKKILKKDFIESNNLEVKAISGKNLTLSSKNGKLYIENIQVLRVEPAGYDGVIYVIDKVILP